MKFPEKQYDVLCMDLGLSRKTTKDLVLDWEAVWNKAHDKEMADLRGKVNGLPLYAIQSDEGPVEDGVIVDAVLDLLPKPEEPEMFSRYVESNIGDAGPREESLNTRKGQRRHKVPAELGTVISSIGEENQAVFYAETEACAVYNKAGDGMHVWKTDRRIKDRRK